MRLAIVVTLAAAVCVAQSAHSSEKKCTARGEAVPLCSILANAARYDAKDVTARGVYYRVIHGSILTGASCEATKVNVRLAEDWKAEKHARGVLNSRIRKNQGTDTTVRGTFRVAHDGCFGQTCAMYEIEIKQLLCAEAPDAPTGAKTPQPASYTSEDSEGASGLSK